MTSRFHWIGVWTAIAALGFVIAVMAVDLFQEHSQLRSINNRLEMLEEEAFSFPGSSTWQWRSHIDDAIAEIAASVQLGLVALRVPTPTATSTRAARRSPTPVRRTLTLSPDAELITTPFLLDMAEKILRGVATAHPSWSPTLQRRYAAAAVAQYLSVHGAIPSAATVNRLLDEAALRLRVTPSPESSQ